MALDNATMRADAEGLSPIYGQDDSKARHQACTIVLQALAVCVGGYAPYATCSTGEAPLDNLQLRRGIPV
jgi:hypothetical protein